MVNGSLTQVVTFIAQALVDHPDEVVVREVEEGDELVVELEVAEEDLGQVIGRQGRTARAIRALLSAASVKLGRRAVLEILE